MVYKEEIRLNKIVMKKQSKALLAIAFMLGSVNLLMAQPGWNWGEQIDVAKEKNALYSDMMKAGRLVECLEPFNWLLENTPDLNESLYQNGAKIYEDLANKETDAVKKAEYQDKTLLMYDKRIEYFGREAYVMNRKVYPAYKFYKGDKTKYEELYNMFNLTFELNGNDIRNNNLAAYMDVVRRYKATGGDVSDEKVIDIYSAIMDVIDVKRAEGKNVSYIDKLADAIDKMLTATIDLNCDFVESILGPKFEATQDIKIAKKIFQLMLNGKCTDRPLAFEAAKIVNESEPSFGISKFLAIKAAQDGDEQAALDFYDQAVQLSDDNIKKAEIYMNIARMDSKAGRKASARSNARKSLAFDPSNKEPYTLIGNLYMSSFDECKKNELKTDDYAIFIAAHKMFKLAGDSKNAAAAKAYFPTIADMFNENYEEGQSFQVGCWVNESVVLERRPEN